MPCKIKKVIYTVFSLVSRKIMNDYDYAERKKDSGKKVHLNC